MTAPALDPSVYAQRFHEAYERLAPTFGYETRPESAVPWDEVPEENRQLMIAVCAVVLADLTAERERAHQWLIEHMADPDDDDDFARLLDRLFRFGDAAWGTAGSQIARVETLEKALRAGAEGNGLHKSACRDLLASGEACTCSRVGR